MSWGNKGGNDNGPWGGGKPSSGGGKKPSGGGQNNQPDIDELLRKSQESLKSAFGGGRGGNRNESGSMRPFIFVILGLLLFWLSTGVYEVDTGEVGVELRFGEYFNQTEPGLHYHLPAPIEKVYVLRVDAINRENIGFRSIGGRGSQNKTQIIPEESLMLTGDKNIISAQFEVQWRIKDAAQYIFNLRGVNGAVKPVAETAIREIMGNTPLEKALSNSRQIIAEKAKNVMQKIMDQYKVGIEIYEVNLLAVDAPSEVVDSFIDVLAAQQEKETLQNNAVKYRDGIVPVAQGMAEKMIKDAEGYSEATVAEATGEAARFMSVYNEYKLAKDVTKKRIYLETMENMMQGMNKVVLSDSAARNVLPYMSLPKLDSKANSGSK